jgi:circadian clock protein KaiB
MKNLSQRTPGPSSQWYQLRLYIAGQTADSTAALANVIELCERYLTDRYEIEVIDILENPRRAMIDSILITPTLIRAAPLPVRKVIFGLNHANLVHQIVENPDGEIGSPDCANASPEEQSQAKAD